MDTEQDKLEPTLSKVVKKIVEREINEQVKPHLDALYNELSQEKRIRNKKERIIKAQSTEEILEQSKRIDRIWDQLNKKRALECERK